MTTTARIGTSPGWARRGHRLRVAQARSRGCITLPGQLLDEQNDKTQSTPRTLESSVRVRLLRLGRLLLREVGSL
ncbi:MULTISPECIES: hypothetical protein [Sorangium]|uniref:hypothetical protein n=1 Tax=Sorangium TaxID=39643 RepID=UPI0012FF736B|nr:hypothetical protein [Sorangium cellulosum]